MQDPSILSAVCSAWNGRAPCSILQKCRLEVPARASSLCLSLSVCHLGCHHRRAHRWCAGSERPVSPSCQFANTPSGPQLPPPTPPRCLNDNHKNNNRPVSRAWGLCQAWSLAQAAAAGAVITSVFVFIFTDEVPPCLRPPLQEAPCPAQSSWPQAGTTPSWETDGGGGEQRERRLRESGPGLEGSSLHLGMVTASLPIFPPSLGGAAQSAAPRRQPARLLMGVGVSGVALLVVSSSH